MTLTQIIESILFVSNEPVKKEDLTELLTSHRKGFTVDSGNLSEDIDKSLEEIRLKYEQEEYTFHLMNIADGWQFLTKKEYYPYVKEALLIRSRKKLTRAALETLAIIAYKQPVTRSELEFIRGVNCDYIIQRLLELQLITLAGKAETPGRPILYKTTEFFMQYLGIASLTDLPRLEDIRPAETDTLGTPMDVEAAPQEAAN